eukprot:CAMPEP_0116049450 /NCGR_PEP_ID=MMETSP0321-20121206/30172_1 /TAXON_ID=163516 /ORGANISM="Leptocylindrus danicus var. danicus, Strain B650" /LENGTH=791 /DNA_ID=CAMNT_0003531879 /DNA_START=150 /DNA_END=2525 /DNA_ORIENTATION=+
MPRNQGTSRKGKPKKTERASGMGRALMRAQTNKSRRKPTSTGTSETHGGMQPSEIAPNIGIQTVDLNADRKSILEMDDMADFLLQAEMANREFVSEKERFVMVDPTGTTLSAMTIAENGEDASQTAIISDEINNTPFQYDELSVPRRPAWTKETTPEELDRMEKDSFLDWRRDIAQREERAAQANGLHQIAKGCVTPFEKNLEVWRQLWRVMESSSCMVLIVDARNPLFYISSDLKQYATVELGKPMLVVVNKSDYLTERQRMVWKRELCDVRGLDCVFFSAFLEQKKLDEHAKYLLDNVSEEEENDMLYNANHDDDDDSEEDEDDDDRATNEEGAIVKTDNDNAISLLDIGVQETLTRRQLLQYLALFAKTHNCKPNERHGTQTPRIQFGMVGFPNVGKSSVINVLMGNSKHTHGQVRVGVASQPGKTKHFQTLLLPDDVTMPASASTATDGHSGKNNTDNMKLMLCDCPGLVFPSFVNSKADLIAAGVYPIEQMRDFWPVINLIVQRVPRTVLNVYYGIELPLPPAWKVKDNVDIEAIVPTGEELLRTYCVSRSMYAAGSGQPHYQQASRIVIRDYVEGKLLYCHPPPPAVVQDDDGVPPHDEYNCFSDHKEFEEETFITALQNTKKLREKFGDDAAVLHAGKDGVDNGKKKNKEIQSSVEGGQGDNDDSAALLLANLDEHEHDDVLDLLDAMDEFSAGNSANGGTKARRQREPKPGKKHRMKKPPTKKKGKRDKDPYGCHPDEDDISSDAITRAASHKGVVVSAGKYSSGGYTRLNYSGARAAVPHQA